MTYKLCFLGIDQYAIGSGYWDFKEAGYALYIFNYRWSGMINGQQAEGAGRAPQLSLMVPANGSLFQNA